VSETDAAASSTGRPAPFLDPDLARTALLHSDADAAGARPLVCTVIVPARNEEVSLPECLDSLLTQSEPGFVLGEDWELLVVDDASTDGTASLATQLATQHPGLRLLTAPPLDTKPGPYQWTGKNAACWCAAEQARGRWLLFTDADTVHAAGSISRSIVEAERHHAQMLSYSPRQIVHGFAQRTVMPLIFAELASVYPPAQVSNPSSRLAAANGQFLLITAEAYFAVGGHRAVAGDVLEDVALAKRLKRAERGLRFRYAPEAVAARMYRSFGEMVEGWTKNLALLLPSPLALAAWRTLDLLLFVGIPVLAFSIPHLIAWQRGALMLLWVRTLWRFYNRAARLKFSALDIAMSMLGVPLFVYLLVRSAISHRAGRAVAWKGRSYTTRR
jgi:glycosyltransferase involved in cell wall biosynthesis